MIDDYLRQNAFAHWLYVLMFTLLIAQSEIWRYLGIRICMHSSLGTKLYVGKSC